MDSKSPATLTGKTAVDNSTTLCAYFEGEQGGLCLPSSTASYNHEMHIQFNIVFKGCMQKFIFSLSEHLAL